jgi:RNA polymerase sigma-70 factor (ECF subfamily)
MTSFEDYILTLAPSSTARSPTAALDVAFLVETYSTLLFRIAHSVLRNRSEAEDVVQDTFVRVLQHRKSLTDINDLRVWLVRIAWNLALDRRRRIRPDQMDAQFTHSLVAATVPVDQAFDEEQRITAVLAELERLPKAERHVLLLSAVEELNNTEIAKVLSKTDSAVRALLFRARTRLRERLERQGARRS